MSKYFFVKIILKMNNLLATSTLICLIILPICVNCLFPYESSSRSRLSLNGFWKFKADLNNEGFSNQWFKKNFKYEVSSLNFNESIFK